MSLLYYHTTVSIFYHAVLVYCISMLYSYSSYTVLYHTIAICYISLTH